MRLREIIILIFLVAVLIWAITMTGCTKNVTIPNEPVIGDMETYRGSVDNFGDTEDKRFFKKLWNKTLTDNSIVQSIEAPHIVGYKKEDGQANSVICNGVPRPICYRVNGMVLEIPTFTNTQFIVHGYKHYIKHKLDLDPDPTHISSLFTDGIIMESDVE